MPELPAAVAYLWTWYAEIQNGERLTWQEIKAWSDITKKDITENEAKAIRGISFLHYNIRNTPVK